MTADRKEIYRQFKAADDAYRAGDLAALRQALGNPADFPNCLQPFELGLGDYPLEYAIYWSPRSMIAALIEIGANPNYPDRGGFPSLIATLSSERVDKIDTLELLLRNGADVNQRGHNDWTPLHYAVAVRDLKAMRFLLEHGADPAIRTRIDDYSTPLEDAETMGFSEAAELIRNLRPDYHHDQK